MKLNNVKAMIIKNFLSFLGGDLQVIHGDPLRIECKQNLPYQKPLGFCLTISGINN